MEYIAIITKPTYKAAFRIRAVIADEQVFSSESFDTEKGNIDFDDDLLTLCEIDKDTYKEVTEWVLKDVGAMLEYLEWMTFEGATYVDLLPDIVEFNADIEEYLISKGLSPNYLSVAFNKILL